jgi:uncharacterized protein (TIGR02246 family)
MTQSTSTEVRDAIVAANENFMATFSRGDAAGMAALYTENGQVLPPNSDFVTGKQAIQTFWQALMDMGKQRQSLRSSKWRATAIQPSSRSQARETQGAATRKKTVSF